MAGKTQISNFSILLLSVAVAVIGIASLRTLIIQYSPSVPVRTIRINYRLPNASARVVETDVTSKLEGVISSAAGCYDITSTSKKGSGQITVKFKKGTDMASARFDIATRIRNVYDELPRGLSYPDISLGISGRKSEPAFTWELRAPLSSSKIAAYADEYIIPTISRIPGVDEVELHGATPFHYVITFDAQKTLALGINGSEIAAAISGWWTNAHLSHMPLLGKTIDVTLSGQGRSVKDFGVIPICNKDGRIVYLRDIASWQYKESPPSSYFRVNGLNTVTMHVALSGNSNLLAVSREIKCAMSELEEVFPEGLSARLSYDSSDYVTSELRKISLRTALCLFILLLFVFISCRSLRYSLIVSASICLNLIVSLAIYSLFKFPLHIYTLAGISVSLGMIIDSTIVMSDHYSREHNRSVFPALAGALATSVFALLMILLLPESERKNLTDFIIVVIINLCVSLLVSWFFVPALVDTVMKSSSRKGCGINTLRRRALVRASYRRYIDWGTNHRWILLLAFIFSFGIPLCLLPSESSMRKKNPTKAERLFSNVVSWRPYAEHRSTIDKAIGGSFALFHSAMDRVNFYREPERKVLSIHAGLLEGATTSQLNDIVKSMENFLSQFEEIDLFTTYVRNYDDALIEVYFKESAEKSGFPYRLKSDVTSMAINFGGANWRISGIDDNYFNNNIVSSIRSSSISLTGYDFDALLAYSEALKNRISGNRRISGAQVRNANTFRQPSLEYNIEYDQEALSLAGISPAWYYKYLSSILYQQHIGVIPTDLGWCDVELVSSDGSLFDLWHVENEPITADSLKASLSSIGNISKQRSGLNITRKNQVYELEVAFDFIGSHELQKLFIKNEVQRLNDEVLPIGFKAKDAKSTWYDAHKKSYIWLIILILIVIYIITAITLESYRLPLSILLTVPISFIGVFLVFGFSHIVFDQGGFASFVILSGLTVKAGIYLLHQWKSQSHTKDISRGLQIKHYMHAFDVKKTPILLTVISTVLGLIPFLSDGPNEVFWFDFAVGTIAGMIFSFIALLFFLPAFALPKRKVKKE